MATQMNKRLLELWMSESTASTRFCKSDSSYKERCIQQEEELKKKIRESHKRESQRSKVHSIDFGIQYGVSRKNSEDTQKIEKVIKSDTARNTRADKGLPSLYQCAEALKERTYLINYSDSLYYYNGKCYDIIEKSDTVIRLYRQKVDNRLGGERSLNVIKNLHSFLKTDSNIAVKEFKENRRVAVLDNGIYDVEKQILRPHTPKEIVFSYINANYVEKGTCKYFNIFLDDITEGNEVLKERIWMFLGYVFMQTTEAKVFFLMGEAPDSGKSLLGKFIQSVYPDKYVSNIALTDFNKEFSVAPIVGSAVNLSLDLPASRLNSLAVSKIKMLTGGDTININQKYEPVFSYKNRAKLIFATNFSISLSENDDAFWNRMVYLPFNRTIPKSKQNKKLFDLISREKDVIVSEALRYAKRLIDLDFQFPTTPQIEYRMQEWQGRVSASIENFVQECCICSDKYRGELVTRLYYSYEEYCNVSGYVPKNYQIFKKFLEEQIGLKHYKMRDGGDNPQSAFKGIKLKSDFD